MSRSQTITPTLRKSCVAKGTAYRSRRSVAALQMYDLPPLARLTDAWWSGIARHCRRAGLTGVPRRLERGPDPGEVCKNPRLLLAQTCGYPLINDLAEYVVPVATPCYAAPGCDGPDYSSYLVVHADCPAVDLRALRGKRCAVNNWESQSGMNALRAAIAKVAGGRPFFSDVIVSGGHMNSLALIESGKADIAAIDCVTHTLLARIAPDRLAATRILGRTESAPGLPYVTAVAGSANRLPRLREALTQAADDASLSEVREALLIRKFAILEAPAYRRIADMEMSAASAGYALLA